VIDIDRLDGYYFFSVTTCAIILYSNCLSHASVVCYICTVM